MSVFEGFGTVEAAVAAAAVSKPTKKPAAKPAEVEQAGQADSEKQGDSGAAVRKRR